MHDDRDHRKAQQNVNKAAGHVERYETDQPPDEQNDTDNSKHSQTSSQLLFELGLRQSSQERAFGCTQGMVVEAVQIFPYPPRNKTLARFSNRCFGDESAVVCRS
jgi:hypothetical protein